MKEVFGKIALAADKVIDANDELEAALAEAWDEEGDSTLRDEQCKDIEGTVKGCKKRLDKVQNIIQKTIWNNFGHPELVTCLELAEAEGERLSSPAWKHMISF